MSSSQIPANLVLGTSSCNTHMIRAENAIKNSLVPFGQKATTPHSVYGLLTTTNIRKGSPHRLHKDGSEIAELIPNWVEVEKYSKPSIES
jgi:hypothetical protein